MPQDDGGTAPSAPDRGRWSRVPGRLRPGYPSFWGPLRTLGGAAYLLAGRDPRTGLLAYAVVGPEALSRSGQPHGRGWRFLRGEGVRTVVNLRMAGDDLPLLRGLGFSNYLHLPIPDGLAPTVAQGEAFLRFVTDPANQPAHVHCLRGIQRTGIMVALYRYAVEGWALQNALLEANRYFPGPSGYQVDWLQYWAAHHSPGDWAPPPAAKQT